MDRLKLGLLFIVLLAMTAACSKSPQSLDGDEPLTLTFSLSTKTPLIDTGGQESDIPGILLDNDPENENNYWGLYAFSSYDSSMKIYNVRMNQMDDDSSGQPDYWQTEYRPSHGASATAFKGSLIVSAYYPYRGTLVDRKNIKYYNPDEPESDTNHDDINPVLTTNSLGHPAIHYGISDFFRARKPTPNGVIPEGVEIENHIRDVILYTHYKTYSVSELKTDSDIKIDISPLNCLIAFKFSLAPRLDVHDNPLPIEQQPNPEDYEIVSVRRHRKGETKASKGEPGYVDHSTFNYDLLTGEITDRRFKSNGLYYEFPEDKTISPNPYHLTGIHPYAVHINSENTVYVDEDEEIILSFVSFPEIYDNLGDIEMEITYRYKLIGAESDEEDDIWVTSSAVINATSTYLQEGWKSGKVYYYHVYISRHEVYCDVEVIPWVEDDLDKDLFYGEIQV